MPPLVLLALGSRGARNVLASAWLELAARSLWFALGAGLGAGVAIAGAELAARTRRLGAVRLPVACLIGLGLSVLAPLGGALLRYEIGPREAAQALVESLGSSAPLEAGDVGP